MYAKDIYKLITTAEELHLTATLIIDNIFGKSEYNVNYDEFFVSDGYVCYQKSYRVSNISVVAIKIGK